MPATKATPAATDKAAAAAPLVEGAGAEGATTGLGVAAGVGVGALALGLGVFAGAGAGAIVGPGGPNISNRNRGTTGVSTVNTVSPSAAHSSIFEEMGTGARVPSIVMVLLSILASVPSAVVVPPMM